MRQVRKVLVRKEKREFIEELSREVTINKQKIYFVEDINKDFHTTDGTVRKKELRKKDGSTIKTTTGKEFVIFSSQSVSYTHLTLPTKA